MTAGRPEAPPSFLLGSFWFFYMGALGIFFPFLALYCTENAGLDGTRTGIVVAAVPLVGLLAQPFWGQAADRTGRRKAVLLAILGGAVVGHLLLFRAGSFWGLLLAIVALAAFATAVVPSGASLSLAELGPGAERLFGRIRACGTVGYFAAVLGFPFLLDRLPELAGAPAAATEPSLRWMFVASAALVAAAAVAVALLPETRDARRRARREEFRRLLGDRSFRRFLSFVFASFLCLQGPMVLFPVLVRSVGGGMDDVSRMWGVMLVPEIPLVAGIGLLIRRLGPRGLVALGVAAGGVRWVASGVAPDLLSLYAVQLLHGPVVAGLLVGAVLYVDAIVPPAVRSTGQALVSMVGMGLGGMASTVIAGWLLDRFGVAAPYLLGGVAGIVLAALAPWWLPAPRSDAPASLGTAVPEG